MEEYYRNLEDEPKDGAICDRAVWKKDNVFFITLVTYFIIILLFISIRIISGLGWLDSLDDKVVDICFSFISQGFIMFFIPLYAIKKISGQGAKKSLYDFGFNKPNKKVIGNAFLLGFLLYFFNIFVAGIFSVILTLLGYRFPSSGEATFFGIQGLLISLVLIAILPGICEETSHRGMLLNSFSNKLGVHKAILYSSILFGLMHLNVVQVFYAAILGYLIALAVMATRSIWTGVIMHFMNNAIGTYFSYAIKNDWPLSTFLDKLVSFAGSFGLLFFIIAIIGTYALIMNIIHVFAKGNYKKNEAVYLTAFLKENPEYVEQKIRAGENISIEDMSKQVDAQVKMLGKKDAVKFYINNHKQPIPLSIKEKTLLVGIFFLGTLTTLFTLVWGLL